MNQQELAVTGFFAVDHQSLRIIQKLIDSCTDRKRQHETSKHLFTFAFAFLTLTASPLGLIANLSSIISLSDRWRMDSNGQTVPDKPWILTMNALALTTGCVSNVVLYLSFNNVLPAALSQGVSALGYLVAVGLYLAMFCITQYVYYNNSGYFRTQGYWHGAIASVFYFIASIMLLANLVFWIAVNEPVDIQLSKSSREIMILTILYIIWLAFGAAIAQSILDISYADATYYCLVITLTLGFGDIVPKSSVGRALAIPYIYGGIVLAGLFAITLFKSLGKEIRHAMLRSRVNQKRNLAFQQVCAAGGRSNEEAFHQMRTIVSRQILHTRIAYILISSVWFIDFWLVGALIFWACEGWTYFEAFYFCGIALAAVGFGDFTPTSSGGRSFFFVWGLLAIPTMAIVTSDLSFLAFTTIHTLLDFLSGRFLEPRKFKITETETLLSLLQKRSGFNENSNPFYIVAMHILNDPAKHDFSFNVWNWAIHALIEQPVPPEFWLSVYSPIQYPINEQKFLMMVCLICLGDAKGIEEKLPLSFDDECHTKQVLSEFMRHNVSEKTYKFKRLFHGFGDSGKARLVNPQAGYKV